MRIQLDEKETISQYKRKVYDNNMNNECMNIYRDIHILIVSLDRLTNEHSNGKHKRVRSQQERIERSRT